MPVSTDFLQTFIPNRRVFLDQNGTVAPASVVHPIDLQQFESLQNEQKIIDPILIEKQRRRWMIILFGIAILAIILTGVILTVVILKLIDTTPKCNPSCLNNGICIATNTCLCDNTTWIGSICQTPIRVFWNFDNSLNDLYNNYNGISSKGNSYFSPDYGGSGSSLWLNRTANQSVTILNPPFLNQINISFTYEMWIYPRTLCNTSPCTDNALIGQFDRNSTDRSFYITIRNQRIYFGFAFDDAYGSTSLSTGQWYHLGYVYDSSARTQSMYLNGYIYYLKNISGPYQGSSGSLTIGTNVINIGNNYFDGYIDSLEFDCRSKSSIEILNDATLVSKLSFDGNLLDSGPLLINATGYNYVYTSGQVNSAVTLTTLLSYVLITGLLRMGTVGWPYTHSIWVSPLNVTGGTIIHASSRLDGAQANAWCLPMMGFTSSGQITVNSWNGGNVPLNGPVLPLNTWTHVCSTYSSTNGLRLYINGSLITSSSAYSFSASGSRMTIILGSSLLGVGVCNTGNIQMKQYVGSLDEFQLYSRELTSQEVLALANA